MLRCVVLLVACLVIATPVAAADVSIVVDISDQHMRVSVDGEPTYSFDVSTGRKGYATPKGHYGVQRMYKKYNSKKYDWAPMPHAIFFYHGFAIHGTTHVSRLGRRASHGCVRLHPQHAAILFDLVQSRSKSSTRIVVSESSMMARR